MTGSTSAAALVSVLLAGLAPAGAATAASLLPLDAEVFAGWNWTLVTGCTFAGSYEAASDAFQQGGSCSDDSVFFHQNAQQDSALVTTVSFNATAQVDSDGVLGDAGTFAMTGTIPALGLEGATLASGSVRAVSYGVQHGAFEVTQPLTLIEFDYLAPALIAEGFGTWMLLLPNDLIDHWEHDSPWATDASWGAGQFSSAQAFFFDTRDLPAPVPLPGAGGLLAVAMGGLVAARRRRSS